MAFAEAVIWSRVGVTKKRTEPWDPSRLELRVQEVARRRAKLQAQQVRWEQLLRARSEFIDWEIFRFWVSLLVEAEGSVPDWLRQIIEIRCPGFLEEMSHRRGARLEQKKPFSLRLSEWIKRRMFKDASDEGWMLAISFEAVRDFRHHRAWSYWRHCEEQWKRKRPVSYPSFERWRRTAEKWNAEPPPGADTRKAYRAFKRVRPGRLNQAVARWIDWESFLYWARTALEDEAEMPAIVVEQLRRRCPRFLEFDEKLRKADPPGQRRSWERLLWWGEKRRFRAARKEGWLQAVVFNARRHPRHVRMVEYWVIWADQWDHTPACYPSFQDWRQAADNYIPDPSIDEEW